MNAVRILLDALGGGTTPAPSETPSGSGAQPPAVISQKTVFRVTGIPQGMTVEDLCAAFSSEFESADVSIDVEHTAFCPSCYNSRTCTALLQFIGEAPPALQDLPHNDSYSFALPGRGDITVDKDFYGLTQLYDTGPGEIKADIVAICGLNGHAYGSWAAKDKLRRMWLRHFLSDDLPQCRTMIFGYNAKLSSNDNHIIPDYIDMFLEELRKARQSEEERKRPILLIGHSFGGIIIAQSIVKSNERGSAHRELVPCIRAAIFFGTPHRGLVVDDILRMLDQNTPREALVTSLQTGSDALKNELRRFINDSAEMGLKIVSFKEKARTRRLKQGPDGKWSRSGELYDPVDESSSVLELPERIEEKLPAEGDHSTMVKFKNNTHASYTSVVRHLQQFIKNDDAATTQGLTAYSAVINQDPSALKQFLSRATINTKQRYQNNTTTLLHIAIANGDLPTVSLLLQNGADPEEVDDKGNTGLHLAILGGHDNIVNTLLENGADITVRNIQQKSALHVATEKGFVPVVEVLLKHGVNVGEKNKHGFTALQTAKQQKQSDIVETLLNSTARDKEGAIGFHYAARGYPIELEAMLKKRPNTEVQDNYGDTPLHYASRGYPQEAELLLKYGAVVNAQNKELSTPLHVAARRGYSDVVGVLLKYKADVTARGPNGQTVLHAACTSGSESVVRILLDSGADIAGVDDSGCAVINSAPMGGPKIVELLLERGADINAKASNGTNVLHMAAHGCFEVVKVLIKHGVCLSATKDGGMNALHIAALNGYEKIAELLLENKMGVDVRNNSGNTALHLTALTGQEKVVELLLKHGANIDLKGEREGTPMVMASFKGHQKAVECLLRNGAALDERDVDGMASIHLAAANGHEKVVDCLVSKGVDPDVVGPRGMTPMHWAAMKGYEKVVSVLLRRGANPNLMDETDHTPKKRAACRNEEGVLAVFREWEGITD